MIRRPPRSTLSSSSAASDVYKRQYIISATQLTAQLTLQRVNVRKTLVTESQHHEMIVQVITVRLVQTQNHGNLRPTDGAPAHLLFQLGNARRTESLMPTRHKRKSCITLLDETHFAHILRRRCTAGNLVLFLVDSSIPARQWTDICITRCSILSRFSCIFMSRIFHPCNMVLHFHVPLFHVSHFQRPHAQNYQQQSWESVVSTDCLGVVRS